MTREAHHVAVQHRGPGGRAAAEANTNIALVKYWGKRDAHLNLPAVGSLSLTLDGLSTRTEVRFDPDLAEDTFELGGAPVEGKPLERVSALLDLVRERAGFRLRAAVRSRNSFPTAAGLASSASGFAALTFAAVHAAGLDDEIDGRTLSQLARRGSGSAARSIYGGLVILHRGERDDGEDCFAEPVEPVGSGAPWDLRLVVGVAGEAPKDTLSTDGMQRTARTSPYFGPWVEQHPAELVAAQQAIARRDLETLGEITERSCLRMHASALAADPGVIYFRGPTVDGFHAVRALRAKGVGAWFTADAGPHVKALCSPSDAARVAETLAAVPGITRTINCAPGPAARTIPVEEVAG
jgi:diphosphomevalonate decarboxylase